MPISRADAVQCIADSVAKLNTRIDAYCSRQDADLDDKSWMNALLKGVNNPNEAPGIRDKAKAYAAGIKPPQPPSTTSRNIAGVDIHNRTTSGIPLPWARK